MGHEPNLALRWIFFFSPKNLGVFVFQFHWFPLLKLFNHLGKGHANSPTTKISRSQLAVLNLEKKRFERLIFPTKYGIPKSLKLVGGFNPLKNNSQIGSFRQVGVKINNIWNHHLEKVGHWPSKMSLTLNHHEFILMKCGRICKCFRSWWTRIA